jgi:endo-1,4-beta-xylanase
MPVRTRARAVRHLAVTVAATMIAAVTIGPASAQPPQKEGQQPPGHGEVRPPGLAKQDTLRWVAPKDLRIGAAIEGRGHPEHHGDIEDPFTHDQEYRRIAAAEFNSLTPENQLKWEFIHPDEQGVYNFGPADELVAFAQDNGMDVRGHTLLWHSQNPAWLEEGDFSADELRDILRDHIHTVVGRYAGKIQQWDVANEIFHGNGDLRMEENIWLRELGPEIIADAFRWAHEADPDAELFLNDFGVESINAKSTAYYDLIQELLDDDVPVHGFGVQGHLSIQFGFPGTLEQNLQRFDDLDVATAITEIDVRMVLGPDGEPTAAQLERQADDYRRALEACLNVEGCGSFTIWGFTDRYSWIPLFFDDQGAALILDEDFNRKPAYHELQRTLLESRPGGEQRYERHPAFTRAG